MTGVDRLSPPISDDVDDVGDCVISRPMDGGGDGISNVRAFRVFLQPTELQGCLNTTMTTETMGKKWRLVSMTPSRFRCVELV